MRSLWDSLVECRRMSAWCGKDPPSVEALEPRLLLAGDLRVQEVIAAAAATRPFDRLQVRFNQEVQEASFTLGDITLAGPGGAIAPITLANIDVAGPLPSINVRSWLDTDALPDVISAQRLGRLTVVGDGRLGRAGDFQADLALTGTPGLAAVSSGYVVGEIRDSQWLVNGAINSLVVRGGATNWLLQAGALNRLTVCGDLTGSTLRLAQAQAGGWALASALVTGRVQGGLWDIQGAARLIRLAGGAADWALDVRGNLQTLFAGDVNRCDLLVSGLLTRLYAGGWVGGSITVSRSHLLHFDGHLQAELTVNPLRLAQKGLVLDGLSVCGAIRDAVVRVWGDTGFIHAESLDSVHILVGAQQAAGSIEDFEYPCRLSAMILGNHRRDNVVRNSTIAAWSISKMWLAGRLQIADTTVQYHAEPQVLPGPNDELAWVPV